jgi:hypothetical protein
MKREIKGVWLASVAVMMACAGQAAESIYSNDFESYTAGNLRTQDSWGQYVNSASPQVTTGKGNNTSKVLGPSTSATESGNALRTVKLGLASYNTGTFSVDLFRGAAGTTIHKMYAGFGSSSDLTSGIAIYATSGNLQIRDGASTGTFYKLRDAAGSSVVTDFDKWMRVTVELDFQNNLITKVSVQNLDTLVTKQLYFDSAGAQATKAYLVDEAKWDRAYIRTGLSTDNAHYIDNLSLTAVSK